MFLHLKHFQVENYYMSWLLKTLLGRKNDSVFAPATLESRKSDAGFTPATLESRKNDSVFTPATLESRKIR